MENYVVYVLLAAATICLPGPAVMLTVNNAIQNGIRKAFAGILGIATGILCISAISATSLGVVLSQSVFIFTAIKLLGAMYLLYLGVKMWRSDARLSSRHGAASRSHYQCFSEGVLVSISNPKAIVFFMSVFPQFIDVSQSHTPQLILLSVTFCGLVVVIHSVYALFSSAVRIKLASEKSKKVMNKVSGGVFVGFAAGLAASTK